MKVGGENKKTLVFAVILMAIAVLLVVRLIWTTRPGPESAAASTTASTTSANGDVLNPSAGTKARLRGREARARYIGVVIAPTLDPRLRLDLLKDSENLNYQGSGRNIFREHLEEIPKPLKGGLLPPKNAQQGPPPQMGPPPPPPINLKFFGWASKPGEARAIFLTQGDSVFVAHEGDIIARRYKVMKISNNAVEIEDVLSNNRQSIPLTQG